MPNTLKVEVLDSCGNIAWYDVPTGSDFLEGQDFSESRLPLGSVKLISPPDVTGLTRCRTGVGETTTTTTTPATQGTSASTSTTSGTTTTGTTTTTATTTTHTTTTQTTAPIPQIVGLYSIEEDFVPGQTTTTGTTTTTTGATTLGTQNSNIGLDLKITYSSDHNGNLRFLGRGTGPYTLSIKRTDGIALVMSNSQNANIPYNTFLGPGSVNETGGYIWDWTMWGVPQTELEISVKRGTTVDIFRFIPSVVTDKQVIIAPATTTTATTTTATGTTTTTGTASTTQSTTTSSPVFGTSYFRNGFGEGNYEDLKNYAPFVPTTNQYGDWARGNTTQYLDNGTVKFGIGKALGGAIKWISYQGGKNWVNTNADGWRWTFEDAPAQDAGRSGGLSMYGTVDHGFIFVFADGTIGNTNEYYDTGLNPVHGGSTYGDHSKITFFERRTVNGYGEVMYCRTIPYIWALRNVLAECTYHCWWWLEGNVIRSYAIVDNHRTDTQRVYQGRQQEAMFVFTDATLWNYRIYTGNSPGTGGAYTDITVAEPIEGHPTLGAIFSKVQNASEYWVASLNTNNKGIMMVPDYNTRFVVGQNQARGGDEYSNASGYINSAILMNFDVNICTAFGNRFYVGDFDDFKAWYQGANITRVQPSWTFNDGNTCGWYGQNCPSRFINNRYSFKIGQANTDPNVHPAQWHRNGSFSGPTGSWKASDIPKLYVYVKRTGTKIRNMRLHWQKPGEDNSDNDYIKDFVLADVDTPQLVTLNMTGTTNWTQIVCNLRFTLANIDQDTDGNEELDFLYIGNVNPAQ